MRRAHSYFDEIPNAELRAELLDLAEAPVDKKTAPCEPEAFHNRYHDALRRLIDENAKAKGGEAIEEAGAPAATVTDLMAALKKSVDTVAPAPAKKASPKAKKV